MPLLLADASWIELVTTWVGLLSAFVVFIIGLRQYAEGQRWKRLEFVAQEIKAFEADKLAERAMIMIDWDGRDVELLPGWKVHVTHAMMVTALRPYNPKAAGYSDEETAMRDAFDDFLHHLDLFGHYVASGTVAFDDFLPYLSYWLDAILNPASEILDEPSQKAIQQFAKEYRYTGVARLFAEYQKHLARTAVRGVS